MISKLLAKKARFMALVEKGKPGGCWTWTVTGGAVNALVAGRTWKSVTP